MRCYRSEYKLRTARGYSDIEGKSGVEIDQSNEITIHDKLQGPRLSRRYCFWRLAFTLLDNGEFGEAASFLHKISNHCKGSQFDYARAIVGVGVAVASSVLCRAVSHLDNECVTLFCKQTFCSRYENVVQAALKWERKPFLSDALRFLQEGLSVARKIDAKIIISEALRRQGQVLLLASETGSTVFGTLDPSARALMLQDAVACLSESLQVLEATGTVGEHPDGQCQHVL